MEFFVTIVNRGVLRVFTNTVKFSSYLQVSEKKHRKQFYILIHFCMFSNLSSLKWLIVTSILLSYASLRLMRLTTPQYALVDFQQLTVVTKSSISDIAVVLGTSLHSVF